MHLLNAGLLDGYAAVGKIHTKRSPHRTDGDHWRRHLMRGILPPGGGVHDLLARFLAEPEAAIWVADGQHYRSDRMVGLEPRSACAGCCSGSRSASTTDELAFPAGSMYWLKPVMIAMIKGMLLDPDEFELETAQVDGTLAHAFERVLGFVADAGGMRTFETGELDRAAAGRRRRRRPMSAPSTCRSSTPSPRTTPGGARASPSGPRSPAASRTSPAMSSRSCRRISASTTCACPQTMGEQWRLAEGAGVDAFCVYHYWFDGRRLLEAPLDGLLARPEVPFRFYLCWANEAWRRNWDGLSGDVLMPQSYGEGFEAGLAASTLPYFADPRYARPDGRRPRFVIYRPTDLPDPAGSVARLRAAWAAAGHPEVELGAVLFHVEGESPVAPELFDFWVEMPPHGLVGEKDYLVGGPETADPGHRPGRAVPRPRLRLRGGDPEQPRQALPPRPRRPGDRRGDAVLGQHRPAQAQRPHRPRRQPGALREVARRPLPRAAGRLLPPASSSSTPGTSGPRRRRWSRAASTARPISTRCGASRAATGAPRRSRQKKSSMSEIIIHIGTHKTGTTTIQDTLFHNRKLLKARGVVYPRIGLIAPHHNLVTRWIDLPLQFRARRSALANWESLARAWAGGDETLLLSSEEFSRMQPAVDFRELRGLVDAFDRRRIAWSSATSSASSSRSTCR